ncbi:MAG: hypothetical protein FJ087_10265 [Deltaproteobacteria bacterium]|nr:hypothetical protein [Deltaproteobacteria bacterium]
MFDVFIIQRIRDEEERRRRDDANRPRLEVPLPDRPEEEPVETEPVAAEPRGVLIIDGDEE